LVFVVLGIKIWLLILVSRALRQSNFTTFRLKRVDNQTLMNSPPVWCLTSFSKEAYRPTVPAALKMIYSISTVSNWHIEKYNIEETILHYSWQLLSHLDAVNRKLEQHSTGNVKGIPYKWWRKMINALTMSLLEYLKDLKVFTFIDFPTIILSS